MSRRPRFVTVSADAYRGTSIEAEMQAGFDEIVALKGGRSWHIGDSRDCPEMIDFWDTTIVVPGLLLALELKSNDRPFESVGQEQVAALLADVRRVVTGVCRPIPRDGEYGYDDVLDYLKGVW